MEIGTEREAVVGVEKMDGLRRVEGGPRILAGRIVHGEKARDRRNEIEEGHHHEPHHREMMALESPPQQLPLRGNRHLLGIDRPFCKRRHRLLQPDTRVDESEQNVADE